MSICPEMRRRIVAFLDGELPDAEAAAVASHLEACGDCRAERARITDVQDLLAAVPAPAPDPQAWKRLRRRLRPGRTITLRRPMPFLFASGAVGSVAAGFMALAVILAGYGPGDEVRSAGRDGRRASDAPRRDAAPRSNGPLGDPQAP